ncbi:transposase [Streptosporangium canum]
MPPRPPRRRHHPGRRPIDDRMASAGIIYVPRTGVAWRDVPASVTLRAMY